MKKQLKFYSHGKLLLSGEYAVLKGALALALPTRQGQWLFIEEGPVNGELHWSASDISGRWFSSVFSLPFLEILMTSDIIRASRLQVLLNAAKKLNPNFLSVAKGYKIDSYLEFHHEWGLGSSSSLIANVALLSDNDPFKLFRMVSSGSGYDLACAIEGKPILYRLLNNQPVVRLVQFSPAFHNHLHFVFLGPKQNTDISLEQLNKQIGSLDSECDKISTLTNRIHKAESLKEFCICMKEHEQMLGEKLDLVPVKELLFPDFNGQIKSLGSWGGNFVLVASSDTSEQVRNYFLNKGLTTVFSFDELILNTSDEYSTR